MPSVLPSVHWLSARVPPGFVLAVCPASALTSARPYLEARWTPFVRRDMERRVNPAAVLPGAASMVVLGMGQPSLARIVPSDAPAGAGSGQLSSLGAYEDYHTPLKAALRNLGKALTDAFSASCRALADSGALNERAFAVRAGLGFPGRNGCVISPEFGPWWYIGLLVTDLPPAKEPAQQPVGVCPPDCRRCADACPTRAVAENGVAAASCVSYLTQKPGDLTETEARALGRQMYGCDLCRRACPFGADARPEETWLDVQNTIKMDDAAYARRFARTAAFWRGPEILRRNARAVLGNLEE